MFLQQCEKLHLAGLLQIEEKQNKQLSPHSEIIVTLDESKIAETKLTDKQEKLIEFYSSKRANIFK